MVRLIHGGSGRRRGGEWARQGVRSAEPIRLSDGSSDRRRPDRTCCSMVRSGRRNRPGAFHTQCHGVWTASGRFRLGRMSISVTSAAFPIGVAFAAFPIGPAPAAVASEQKGEWGGWGRGGRDAKTRGPIGSSTAAQIGFAPTAVRSGRSRSHLLHPIGFVSAAFLMGCVPAAFPIGFVSAALAASHGTGARGKKGCPIGLVLARARIKFRSIQK